LPSKQESRVRFPPPAPEFAAKMRFRTPTVAIR
jgi:hypothetical protein